ncbi:MAG: ATP-binding protein [Bacteroidia bacterium]|nr:ATP-binding protein [Bacteroidia bacterium]
MISNTAYPESASIPLKLLSATLLGFGAPVTYDLDDSLFLSGPAGQGKEKLLALLTHWYLPQSEPFLDTEDQTPYLLYQWSKAGKALCSVHSVAKGECVAFLIEGSIESSWGKGEILPPLAEWIEALQAEGRRTSPIMWGEQEWLSWLNGSSATKPKRNTPEFLLSPHIHPHILQALRYRPEPTPFAWQAYLSATVRRQIDLGEDVHKRLLAYRQHRVELLRDEEAAISLPQLRQWQSTAKSLHQEKAFLMSQCPAIYQQHLQEGEIARQNHQAQKALLPLHEKLDSLSLRLGWLEWQIQESQAGTDQPTGAGSEPALWWQARKLIEAELRSAQAAQLKTLHLLSQPFDDAASEEESSIIFRVRQLEKELPGKFAALEKSRLQLDWIRKEKEAEAARIEATQQKEHSSLKELKEELEAKLKDLTAEARRPQNTLRHWLDKNYPDWKQGPGKVLAPELLASRGMFPSIDRINDLFFGVRLNLDDLPEPEAMSADLLPDLEEQVAETQKLLSEFQIRCQHEEKLLQARYRQRTRPVQKDIQQAEYELQQHERELGQLRQRHKDLRHHRRQTWEQTRFLLQYDLNSQDKELAALQEQLHDLDLQWQAWLNQENPTLLSSAKLSSLLSSWKKEKKQLLTALAEAEKAQELARVHASEVLDRWQHHDQLLESWIKAKVMPRPAPQSTAVSALDTATWIKRFRLWELESAASRREGEAWQGRFPWLAIFDSEEEDPLESLESAAIAARKATLAQAWFPQLKVIAAESHAILSLAQDIERHWQAWAKLWEQIAQNSPWKSFAPSFSVMNTSMIRALEAIRDLCHNHQHAVAGPSLFNHQDPQQTLVQTLHLLDNLWEANQHWQHQAMSLDLPGAGAHGLSTPNTETSAINIAYHTSYLMTMGHSLPGPVMLAAADEMPIDVVSEISSFAACLLSSQWPLPVSGRHFWVTNTDKEKTWEALPFAIGNEG